MLLAGAREQKFFGLWIAGKAQSGIFFQDFVNRDADFVFIGACFWLNSKGNRGFRNLRRRVKNRRALIAERFARRGLLEFDDRADITSVKVSDFGERLALYQLNVLKALRNAAIEIRQRGVVFQ